MRILAFSDLHLSRPHGEALVAASQEADLVIGAGDFCNRRAGLGDAMALLAGIEAPFVAVPGNAESDAELRQAALPNMIVLHAEEASVAGLRIFGLGGGIPVTPFGAWSFDLTEPQAEAALGQCGRPDILVTHSPPKGIADETSDGESIGSRAIRAAIARAEPALALCGHVHDSWGRSGSLGPTRVVNLGPRPNWFDWDRP